jgi:hypothetical protein
MTEPDEDPELEAILRALIKRQRSFARGSAERAFVERQLDGLSRTRYLAQEYIHDLESEYSCGYSSSRPRGGAVTGARE